MKSADCGVVKFAKTLHWCRLRRAGEQVNRIGMDDQEGCADCINSEVAVGSTCMASSGGRRGGGGDGNLGPRHVPAMGFKERNSTCGEGLCASWQSLHLSYYSFEVHRW